MRLSPKKSKQKKGDRKTLPCGFPFVQVKKWETVAIASIY
jgi:hypothetical protein